MTSTNALNLTDHQFRVLYEILTDIYPVVKDPEPAFIELFNYVTEEFELNHVKYSLSPSVEAFARIYPDTWSEWVARETPEWKNFKVTYDRMKELGLSSFEDVFK